MKNHQHLCLFFLLAYLISWSIWLPLYLPYFGIHALPILPYHHALGAAGPIASAFIVAWIENKRAGVYTLAKKMTLWKVHIFWYFIAFFSPFVLLVVSALLLYVIDEQSIAFSQVITSREFPKFSMLSIFLYNLITFGYGEETGWRGFALPRLQNSFSPKSATVVLAFLWAGWHIPLFLYRPGYTGMDIFGVSGWLFSIFTGAILLTWIYNSTSGSILLAAIFHATIDIAFTSEASTQFANYLGFLITVWGIVTWFLLTKKSAPHRSA